MKGQLFLTSDGEVDGRSILHESFTSAVKQGMIYIDVFEDGMHADVFKRNDWVLDERTQRWEYSNTPRYSNDESTWDRPDVR